MKRLARHFVRDARGAGALEFAIIAPVLIAVLLGGLTAGMALYSGAAVRNAVQRASRVLIYAPSTSAATVKAVAVAQLVNVPVTNLNLTITQEQITTAAAIKRVTWTYNYAVSVPFLPAKTFTFDSSLVVPMAPT
jgi:Flp pilus assembly protein TadG